MNPSGRAAFEELVGVKEAHIPTPYAVLSGRDPVDSRLFKIASELSPRDPHGTYESLGGEYVLNKFSASPAKAGGLRSDVKLFPHQQEAVEKIIAKNGSLLLSHPVGSGKTLSSIAAFEAMRSKGMADRALVVVPASLRTNFAKNGVERFTTSRSAIFGNAQEQDAPGHVSVEHPDKKAQYHIVSYELFRQDPKKYIDAAGADTVIYDELHRAKNEGVLTSTAIKEARQYHKNFIGMTGSIVSNTPADIVPLVDAMTNGNHLLGNKTTFESRFVRKDDKTGVKELKNPQVLRALLGPYVHHVDMAALNLSAPQKHIEEVRVDMGKHQTELYRYITNTLDPITRMRLKAGVSKLNDAQFNDLFSKLLKLRQVSNSIHTVDAKLSLSQSAKDTPKIKRVLDDVEEHLRETPDGQVVIHTNMIQGGVDVLTAGLRDRGVDHALFIGKGNPGVTEKTRQHGVKDFQEGRKKVIVLSAAGGEGLDLPNTTFMAMVDGHFNPEKINQAEARGIRAGGQAHRSSEKRNVLVRRYVSVMPNDVGRLSEVAGNIWDNMSPSRITARLSGGGSAFYNPFKKEPSTDEYVYGIAKRKAHLNAGVHGTLKKASADDVFATHEEFEDFLVKTALSAAGALVPAGALLGAGWGALMGGTAPRSKEEAENDPNAHLRNRVAGALGGAATGALSGYQLSRGAEGAAGITNAAINIGMGPYIGKSIADVFAPKRRIPKSLQQLLGDKGLEYSDKKLFEKYWDTFGNELEAGGVSAKVSDPELESRFVRALGDLYRTAGAVKPGSYTTVRPKALPSKAKFIATNLAALSIVPAYMAGMGVVSETAASKLMGRGRPDAKTLFTQGLLNAIPATMLGAAGIANNYRALYVDPGVTSTSSRADTRKRAKFNDEQLQTLLRGGNVDELKVKSHLIK